MRKLSAINQPKRSLVFIFLLLFTLQSLLAQTLRERIQGLPDVISVEAMDQNQFFKEAYVVYVKQLIDHQKPEKGSFPQRVVVSHFAYDRPVVFITEGYGGDYAANKRYLNELCPLLSANQVFVEHRYFGKSKPDSVDWQTLTVRDAAADQHHVVELFKKIYSQKWISTGISKGGETTLYHRMLYPNDVDVSVPYVAPLNFSVEENRHPRFIEKQVAGKVDRRKVKNFQTEVLKRKKELMPLFEKLCQDRKFQFRAPLSEIYDYSVLEFSFSFWQWGNSTKDIPALTSTDKEIFNYWQKVSSCDYFDIKSGMANAPFFVQAQRELGYYAYDPKPFKKVIDTQNTTGYIAKLFLDKNKIYPYDPQMSEEVDKYLKNSAKKVMLIYGGVDPWSASAADGGKNPGVIKIVQKDGSHRTRINTLPEPQRVEAIQKLKSWLE